MRAIFSFLIFTLGVIMPFSSVFAQGYSITPSLQTISIGQTGITPDKPSRVIIPIETARSVEQTAVEITNKLSKIERTALEFRQNPEVNMPALHVAMTNYYKYRDSEVFVFVVYVSNLGRYQKVPRLSDGMGDQAVLLDGESGIKVEDIDFTEAAQAIITRLQEQVRTIDGLFEVINKDIGKVKNRWTAGLNKGIGQINNFGGNNRPLLPPDMGIIAEQAARTSFKLADYNEAKRTKNGLWALSAEIAGNRAGVAHNINQFFAEMKDKKVEGVVYSDNTVVAFTDENGHKAQYIAYIQEREAQRKGISIIKDVVGNIQKALEREIDGYMVNVYKASGKAGAFKHRYTNGTRQELGTTHERKGTEVKKIITAHNSIMYNGKKYEGTSTVISKKQLTPGTTASVFKSILTGIDETFDGIGEFAGGLGATVLGVATLPARFWEGGRLYNDELWKSAGNNIGSDNSIVRGMFTGGTDHNEGSNNISNIGVRYKGMNPTILTIAKAGATAIKIATPMLVAKGYQALKGWRIAVARNTMILDSFGNKVAANLTSIWGESWKDAIAMGKNRKLFKGIEELASKAGSTSKELKMFAGKVEKEMGKIGRETIAHGCKRMDISKALADGRQALLEGKITPNQYIDTVKTAYNTAKRGDTFLKIPGVKQIREWYNNIEIGNVVPKIQRTEEMQKQFDAIFGEVMVKMPRPPLGIHACYAPAQREIYIKYLRSTGTPAEFEQFCNNILMKYYSISL